MGEGGKERGDKNEGRDKDKEYENKGENSEGSVNGRFQFYPLKKKKKVDRPQRLPLAPN